MAAFCLSGFVTPIEFICRLFQVRRTKACPRITDRIEDMVFISLYGNMDPAVWRGILQAVGYDVIKDPG